jgi:hypothetical protein
MPDLDERLRRAFDSVPSVQLAEVVERAGKTRTAPERTRGRLIAVGALSTVLIAGTIALVGDRLWHRNVVTGTHPTTTAHSPTTVGPKLPYPVRIRVVLDKTHVVAGTTIHGIALLTNETGKTITVKACAVDGWFLIGLGNSRIPFNPITPTVACRPSVRLSPGLNRLRITVLTSYNACTQTKASATPQMPPCLATGQPPLPPGGYTTKTVILGLPRGSQVPAAIHVTLVTGSPAGETSKALTPRDLQALSSGGYLFSRPGPAGGRAEIAEPVAVRDATSFSPARLVAVGLATLKLPSGSKELVYALLVDPSGSHACISYGPEPAPKNCTINVYAIAINAYTGGMIFSGTWHSSLLPALPLWKAS